MYWIKKYFVTNEVFKIYKWHNPLLLDVGFEFLDLLEWLSLLVIVLARPNNTTPHWGRFMNCTNFCLATTLPANVEYLAHKGRINNSPCEFSWFKKNFVKNSKLVIFFLFHEHKQCDLELCPSSTCEKKWDVFWRERPPSQFFDKKRFWRKSFNLW
jgi:hypothetical protein